MTRWANIIIVLAFACAGCGSVATTPVYDIPRLEQIKVDGNPAPWEQQGFCVNALAGLNGTIVDPAEFCPQFRLAWDEHGLLVLATIHDDTLLESRDVETLWKGACFEVLVAGRVGGPDYVQALISPGMADPQGEVRMKVADKRASVALKNIPATVTAGRTKIDGGYVIEALFPWDMLGIEPSLGREIAVQVQVDHLGPSGLSTAAWYPQTASGHTEHMVAVRLAEAPSSPVRAASAARYEGHRRASVYVVGDAELAGREVEVRDGSAKGASEPLIVGRLSVGPHPTAWLNLPVALHRSAPPLAIWVDGRLVNTVDLGDLEPIRWEAFRAEELGARGLVFSDEAFPRIGFQRPAEVEDAIGPYTIATKYYDNQFHRVTAATQPGRYGAILEIKDPSGQVLDRRYATLLRTPGKVPQDAGSWHPAATIPQAMGIRPAVLREQKDAVEEMLLGDIRRNLDDYAPLLASLYEWQVGHAGLDYVSPWRNDDQWWHDLRKSLGLLTPYKMVVRLPQGYEQDKSKRWPLILYLHGSGSRGENLANVRHEGVCKYAEAHPELPCIVISPLCPRTQWWSTPRLIDLLDQVTKEYSIDPDRVYVTGFSMGGFGSWNLAASIGSRFAAVAPVAGVADPQDAAHLRNVNIWAFHGDADEVVPLFNDQRGVEAIKAAGGNAKLTIYPGLGHGDASQRTYKNPEFYAWLLRQHRGSAGSEEGQPLLH